ncbi:hypothetical protein C1H46_006919 [Malus baccata]|uniref:CR-type domain-containing protein n=1 Tax=Malus baccata TaxID=106549 RepID=A0A540N996_MALBA|nr:hypothetical protein C1H46_006919 [Malus baccata]
MNFQVVAISVGFASVAVGIGIPVFYETQIDSAAKRDNTQPCFPCNGTGAHTHVSTTRSSGTHVSCCLSLCQCQLMKLDDRASLCVSEKCRFCTGSGTVTVELGGGEKEVSNCINCEGVGSFTCTTCQGSGIQPRYLDRREFKDDD